MSNTTRLIMFWGVAILLYIAVSRSKGTSTVIQSFGGFVKGTTKTLQGR